MAAEGAVDYWREHGLGQDPFPAERAEWFSDDDLKRRLDLLVYLIQSGDPMVLVRGAEGSGRSTLLAQFLGRAGSSFTVCAVRAEPGFNPVRLLVALSQAFADELEGGDSEDLGDRLDAIQRDGGTPLLLVDDADRLATDTLDTVLELYERMGESGRLLRVVLVTSVEGEGGLDEQPRFAKYRQELRTLDVAPFTEAQTEAYLAWCLAAAGGEAKAVFSAAQRRSIQEEGGGLPGKINQVARRLLGGEPVSEASEGGVMNLSKLRDLDIKKVLTWSGVALLLLAILIFQGRINELIQGDNAPKMFEREEEPEPVAIERRPGAMPQGTLPNQVVRERTPFPKPEQTQPPVEEPPEQTPEPEPMRELEAQPPREIAARAPATAQYGAPMAGGAVAEGMAVEATMVAAAPAEGESTSMAEVDPLAGAPLEHRIPQLEEPTPFQPSEEPAAEATETAMAESTPPSTEAGAPVADMAVQPPVAEGAPAETPAAEAAKPEAAPGAEKSGEPVAAAEETPAAEPPVKMEPSPTVEAEPVKLTALKGEQWLLEQPPGHIALQVLGGADREVLAAFAEKHGLVEEGALFKGVNRGRTWYGLLSGVYPSLGAARDALKALPRLPAGYTPWTRSVASVQKEINKAK